MSKSLWPHELQHARLPCPSPSPGVHPDPRPSSQWCHPAISSSAVPFSSYPQSFWTSESFPMSQLFAGGGQSTGVSASASFLPKKCQDWSPSEWAGWISLQSKGLSRVFSNTTLQKHQFFGAQLSSQSNSHIHTWPQEKPEPCSSANSCDCLVQLWLLTISKDYKFVIICVYRYSHKRMQLCNFYVLVLNLEFSFQTWKLVIIFSFSHSHFFNSKSAVLK